MHEDVKNSNFPNLLNTKIAFWKLLRAEEKKIPDEVFKEMGTSFRAGSLVSAKVYH